MSHDDNPTEAELAHYEHEVAWAAQVLGMPEFDKPYQLTLSLGPLPVPGGSWNLQKLPTDESGDHIIGLQIRRALMIAEIQARIIMLPDDEFETLMARAATVPGPPVPLEKLRRLRERRRPQMQARQEQLTQMAESLFGPGAGAEANRLLGGSGEEDLSDDEITRILADLNRGQQ